MESILDSSVEKNLGVLDPSFRMNTFPPLLPTTSHIYHLMTVVTEETDVRCHHGQWTHGCDVLQVVAAARASITSSSRQ